VFIVQISFLNGFMIAIGGIVIIVEIREKHLNLRLELYEWWKFVKSI
jgi:hypothetical protein